MCKKVETCFKNVFQNLKACLDVNMRVLHLNCVYNRKLISLITQHKLQTYIMHRII